MPCPRSLRAKPILAPTPLLLGGGDLAALCRAVLRGGLGHALALAAVLALAVVDAFTLHRAASLFVHLVLRERRARNEERGDSGGEDGILDRHVCSSRE